MAKSNSRMVGPLLLGTSAVTVYTCPPSTKAVTRNIHVFNETSSPATLNISIGTDASGTQIFTSYSIAAHRPLDIRSRFVLTENEIIQAFSNTDSALSLTISGSTDAVVSIFPIRASADNRFVVQADGTPFPILGRTAWGLQAISPSDRAFFLDNTLSHGFDAIELQVPNHIPKIYVSPFNANGDLPFNKRLDGTDWDGTFTGSSPDLSTPNTAFWNFNDGIVADCRSRSLLMLGFPAYLGNDAGEGWRDVMTNNGSAKTQGYGAFVATRYKDQPHIVWMTAGDTNSGYDAEVDLITGIKSVTGQLSTNFSAERGGGSISSDGLAPLGGWMTLNGAYDWQFVITQCRRAYAYGLIPAYLLEEPYDLEGPDGTGVNIFATQPTRRYEWWGWLSTIGGYVAGNGYIWPFQPTGTPPPSPQDSWKLFVDAPGTFDLQRLNAFIRSIPWWTLVPSGLGVMGTLITAGGGSVDDPSGNYVSAACNPAGTLWVAYAGPGRASTFTVDMTVMSGTALARWFNPWTAAYTTIGSIANTGTHVFTVPGDNGNGFSDWALVMTA